MTTSANPHVVDFHEESHTLSVAGRVLPSVTQVIAEAGLLGNAASYFSDESAWRGSYVHLICELDDNNDLDESVVKPEYAGYLASWRAFKRDLPFVPEVIERPMADPALGVAGIMDRYGHVHRWPAVVDLKSGAISKATALQTAAYVHLCRVNGIDRAPGVQFRRLAVRLQADGKYSVKERKGVEDWKIDWTVFSAALAILNWRKNA